MEELDILPLAEWNPVDRPLYIFVQIGILVEYPEEIIQDKKSYDAIKKIPNYQIGQYLPILSRYIHPI